MEFSGNIRAENGKVCDKRKCLLRPFKLNNIRVCITENKLRFGENLFFVVSKIYLPKKLHIFKHMFRFISNW